MSRQHRAYKPEFKDDSVKPLVNTGRTPPCGDRTGHGVRRALSTRQGARGLAILPAEVRFQ